VVKEVKVDAKRKGKTAKNIEERNNSLINMML
jgi:hypothetical protein